ncbi:MAG TPA: hypothetical protein VER11_12650 [Polyangiaceae bacterium]|nr:hypothetical protein [Polyangiaceae bacterium]
MTFPFSLAGETGARSRFRKPAFSGGFSVVFNVRYWSVRGRDEAREIPVVVVVVRVLEANIAESGCHAEKGTASAFEIAIQSANQ